MASSSTRDLAPNPPLTPLGGALEAVGVYTGIDGGDIHVIEALQSIVERRKEVGPACARFRPPRGEAFWKA